MVIDVKIQVKFGSNFQEEVALRCLESLLEGWKEGLKAQHQKNEATFIIQKTESI